jgi:hypothetical protein
MPNVVPFLSTQIDLNRLRPVPPLSNRGVEHEQNVKQRVLIVGVYLADKPNNVEAIIENFARSVGFRISQRWAAVGSSLEGIAGSYTFLRIADALPKFTLINSLIGSAELALYDYLVVCDDDLSLPPRFLDGFISLQQQLGYRLAQPARTDDSYIDHEIVKQCVGYVARQTLFVECGPLFCMHRSIYELLVPFEAESPMGWGYENIWSWRLSQRGFPMGIIDCLPVKHKMRKPCLYYSSEEAGRAQAQLLASHPHNPDETCKQVVGFVAGAIPQRNVL